MSTSHDPMTPASVLLRSDVDGIATLTLNRPGQYNALSEELLTGLQRELDQIAEDEAVRVVIIAAGGKAFCAGHDLKEMRASEDRAVHQALFDRCGHMMISINRLPQPVIARVNGIATAAGCQLVANCDLAVAAEDARFAVSGINVGLFCSTPAVPLSRNVLRKQAMHMLLTGDFISAKEAMASGLVNEVVAAAELESATHALAVKIAEKSSARTCSTSNCQWIWPMRMPTQANVWHAIWILTMHVKASMRSFTSVNPSGRIDSTA